MINVRCIGCPVCSMMQDLNKDLVQLKGPKPTLNICLSVAGDMAMFMSWVDQSRKLGVYTNADTPADALIARKNGAEGIGLVRTEHMFFSSAERIAAVRRMIAAEELDVGGAVEALATLKEFQRADFEGIFEAMDGLPVTIRMLVSNACSIAPARECVCVPRLTLAV